MKPFDYWGWWSYCVKELKIPPSEAWRMDYVEISHLLESPKSDIDISLMLNYERVQNGAKQEWLQRK